LLFLSRLRDKAPNARTRGAGLNEGDRMNPWILLGFCIVAEVTGTLLLTKSQGFARPGLGFLSLAIFGGCFWGLSIVLTRIPVGVTYAIWAGVGIALISVAGWLFLRQSLTPTQILFIVMIATGAVGLKLTTSET
jgi:small multidrug resistance pump